MRSCVLFAAALLLALAMQAPVSGAADSIGEVEKELSSTLMEMESVRGELDRLEELAARYPAVLTEVRGAGLLLGLRCQVANTELLDAIRAEGLLAATAGDNVLRLAPPLIIDQSHVEEAIEILDRACARLSGAR